MWHLFVQLKAQNKDYLKAFPDTISEDKNIIVKAYPMQKESSGVKQVNGGLMKNTRRILMMYTQQNYFTRSSLAIAIFSRLKKKTSYVFFSVPKTKISFFPTLAVVACITVLLKHLSTDLCCKLSLGLEKKQ